MEVRWNEIRKYTDLTLSFFLEGVSILFDNVYFSFDGTKYKQTQGTPMGSPVSPSLCELVMEYVDRTVVENCKKAGIQILFYARYVDDGFLVANSRHFSRILKEFNSIHPRLQFTIEHEQDQRLSFLDTKVHRCDNGSLLVDWFHKETWSGRYLNFDSFLPVSYKTNTVSLMTRKVLETSDEVFHAKNFELVTNTLLENGYPLKFIQRVMKDTVTKLNCFGPENQKTTWRYISLPYEPVMFNRIKHLLEPHGIRPVARPSNTLGRSLFSNLKDKIPKENLSNVVYGINCSCGDLYIGNTGQYMSSRFQQHINGDADHSALSAHIIETGHQPSFNDMEVLCVEPNKKVREIKEMVYIKTTTNLNSQLDCMRLGNYFNDIFKLYRTRRS